jgi:hypothetical protein
VAEHFVLCQPHVVVDIGEDRGLDEQALRQFALTRGLAAGDETRALGFRGTDETHDSPELRLVRRRRSEPPIRR